MPFDYTRLIRFHETDGAGVVYFANGLVLCHEAYEASLEAAGIGLREFFSPTDLAYPITHASIDFRRPLYCGDRIVTVLTPEQSDESSFAIAYHLHKAEAPDKVVATAQTHHVCIEAQMRSRHPLPENMLAWIKQFGSKTQEA